jgi:signal transduction histidine kinase
MKFTFIKALTINLVAIFGLSGFCYAQSDYIDSLRQLVSKLPDTEGKAKNLINISKAFLNSNNDSALLYSDKAYNLAEMIDYKEALIDADFIRGLILKNKSHFGEAFACFEKALQTALILNDSLRIAKLTYNSGQTLKELSDFNGAIEKYRTSLSIYTARKDTFGIAANYNAIGTVYKTIAVYDSAAVYYTKAVIFSEAAGIYSNLGLIYVNLGDVYYELWKYDEARKYVLKSKEINEKNKNLSGLALSYITLGKIDSEEGNFQAALDNYRQAEILYGQLKDTLHLCDIRNNIGIVYKDQRRYKEALEYYSLALEGYTKLAYLRGVVVVLGNMANVRSLQARYSEAFKLNDTVLKLATQFNFVEYRKDALNRISMDYLKQGNYRMAYEYQALYYESKDSIFNIEKERLISDLLFKYEKEKDQARILALEMENLQKDLEVKQKTLQRNAFLFSVIIIVSLAIFMFLYINQRRRKDRIIAQHRIQQLEEEKKLMAAQALVEGQEEERKRIAHDLHDGLGVLLSATKMQFTAIRDVSPANMPFIERATQLLEQAAGDVRKISHNMMPGLLTKMGLFEAVEDLFENISDNENLTSSCFIPEGLKRLPENQEIMVFRIIQEMVNNTIKHAEAKSVRLEMNIQNAVLELLYTDDGKGFDVEKSMESRSLGLKSIQSRVNFLKGELSIDSQPGRGTRYLIKVPV